MADERGLISALREQKEAGLKGGIYHRTQVDFAYNSNHIEGSRLTHEQTRYIFETNTLGITSEATNVDDIVETVNHFQCLDFILDHVTEPLSEQFVKELHKILKTGTSDSRKAWFRVGEYKSLPNEVGGAATCQPEEVASQMAVLINSYTAKEDKTFDDILDFIINLRPFIPFRMVMVAWAGSSCSKSAWPAVSSHLSSQMTSSIITTAASTSGPPFPVICGTHASRHRTDTSRYLTISVWNIERQGNDRQYTACETCRFVYTSSLYAKLENEATKYWWIGTNTLYGELISSL